MTFSYLGLGRIFTANIRSCCVGRDGVIRVLEPPIPAEEREALEQSARLLRTGADRVQVRTA